MGAGLSRLPAVVDVDMVKAFAFHSNHGDGVSKFIRASQGGTQPARFVKTVSQTGHGTVSYVTIGTGNYVVKTRKYDSVQRFNDAMQAMDRLNSSPDFQVVQDRTPHATLARKIGLVSFFFKADQTRRFTVTIMERVGSDLFNYGLHHRQSITESFKRALGGFLVLIALPRQSSASQTSSQKTLSSSITQSPYSFA